MNAIIFGAPGSGKGTYASRLQSKLGVDVIAMGDIFRENLKAGTTLGKKVKSYVEKGLLVPDDIVIDVLKQRLAKIQENSGFILDGFCDEIGGIQLQRANGRIHFPKSRGHDDFHVRVVFLYFH